MQRIFAGACVAALFAVAACGGPGQAANAAPGVASATGPGGAAAAAPEPDLFAFAAGAHWVQWPEEEGIYGLAYGPYNLLDETPATDARAEAGRPAVYVLELLERTELSRIALDSDGMSDDDKTPKTIRVEVSDTSATSGFTTVLETDLKQAINDQVFQLASKPTGRWVRLTLLSNYGASHYGFTGFRGYGRQLTQAASLPNLSGTYTGANGWGDVHLKQEGTRVIGCYEYLEGVLSGGIENGILKVDMAEHAHGEVQHHLGLFLAPRDGKSIFGLIRSREAGPDDGWGDVRYGDKVSDDIGTCPQIPGYGSGTGTQGQLASQLQAEGRARLDGVNFDFNSATIQPASRPLLDQVAQMLKGHPDWKITLEGHTDAIGGEAFNQSLSTQRAAAVKAYLAGQGVSASNLTSVGFGFSKPVASNDTQAGRAQNRRVEIVKG